MVYHCLSLQLDIDFETKQSHFNSQLLNSNEQCLFREKIAIKKLLARSTVLLKGHTGFLLFLATCDLRLASYRLVTSYLRLAETRRVESTCLAEKPYIAFRFEAT